MKSGSLNLLEPSGPHRACYWTASFLSIQNMETLKTFNVKFCTAFIVKEITVAAVAGELKEVCSVKLTACFQGERSIKMRHD